MIDFKEEIKKYKPILNVDDVQSELKDTMDLLEQMSKVNQIIQQAPTQIQPQAPVLSAYSAPVHTIEPRSTETRTNEARIPELRVIETEAKIEARNEFKNEPRNEVKNETKSEARNEAKIDTKIETKVESNATEASINSETQKEPIIDNVTQLTPQTGYAEPLFDMPANEER